jgi:hypothetical protein
MVLSSTGTRLAIMIRSKIITIIAGVLGLLGVVGLIAGTALDRAVGEPDLGGRVELDAPAVVESAKATPAGVGKATPVAPAPRTAGDDQDDSDDKPRTTPEKKAPKNSGDDDADDGDDGGDDDGDD